MASQVALLQGENIPFVSMWAPVHLLVSKMSLGLSLKLLWTWWVSKKGIHSGGWGPGLRTWWLHCCHEVSWQPSADYALNSCGLQTWDSPWEERFLKSPGGFKSPQISLGDEVWDSTTGNKLVLIFIIPTVPQALTILLFSACFCPAWNRLSFWTGFPSLDL